MEDIVQAISHSLNNAQTKLTWYSITGDSMYMDECKEWQSIASYYMNQLIMEQTDETCKAAS